MERDFQKSAFYRTSDPLKNMRIGVSLVKVDICDVRCAYIYIYIYIYILCVY